MNNRVGTGACSHPDLTISNGSMNANEKEFAPSLLEPSRRTRLVELILSFQNSDLVSQISCLRALSRDVAAVSSIDDLRLASASSLLADLLEQGWGVNSHDNKIWVSPPIFQTNNPLEVKRSKSRTRAALQMDSNRQIASPSVQDFIRRMEKERIFGGRIVSVKSLIDNGPELIGIISTLIEEGGSEVHNLEDIIKPEVQICEANAKCRHTGLYLQDIWRYFRLTWSLAYNPLPGRTLRILVRNRARPNSPIMGIAMLASPAANLYVRDSWIGWRLEDVITNVLSENWNPKKVTKRLLKQLEESINLVRSDDIVSNEELRLPSEKTLFKLRQFATRAAGKRIGDLKARDASKITKTENHIDIRAHDKSSLSALTDDEWKSLSGSSLFVKKRAEQLAQLLDARRVILAAGLEKAPVAALYEMLATVDGRKAISTILNEIRKVKLASEVADVSVCGGIAPYNCLLSGKLVALLMGSREVTKLYAERYSQQPSEIASQLAGRRIVRSANLKVLTTTSLYGVGSSQYNRLKLRAGVIPELARDIEWCELEPTVGFTVTHVSRMTVEFMRSLAIEVYGTRRINSVFGEGSSPRTRQIREGLGLLGIYKDDVLMHTVGRLVYAIELFPGARTALIGIEKEKSATLPSTRIINRAWLKRWILNRAQRPETIRELKQFSQKTVTESLKHRAAKGALDLETNPDDNQLALNLVQTALTVDLVQ